MSQLLSHAAAVAGAVAAFFVVVVALGIMLGADKLRDAALRLVGIGIVAALLLQGAAALVGGAARSGSLSAGGTSTGCSSGDLMLCTVVGVGHAVLAVVLVLRRLRPRAGEERAQERRRARMRERVRVPPRDVEIDP